MRYRVYIGYDRDKPGHGRVELEDGTVHALGPEDVARLNDPAARADPHAVIAAIVAERQAPEVRHG